jgi:cation diffusion facilitator family transporter
MRKLTFPEGLSITPKAMDERSERHRAATIALAATVGLTALKIGAGVISGSVGVFSEGVHSFLDLVSAALSYFTVPQAVKPADEDHPFGHGKIETLSSLFESLLLVVAAILICFEGLEHLRHPQPVAYPGFAMAVIVISLLVSYGVYRHNLAASEKTDSSALRVNALHFFSDVIASVGILVGLVLLRLTGWLIIDPIMAFLVAGYILMISAQQVKEALLELSDRQLPDSEISEINELIARFQGRMIEAHDIRTRKSGSTRHIDFHLVVCGQLSVDESHQICDEIEAEIISHFSGSSITIHVEPCEYLKTECRGTCAIYQARHGKVMV